jgi:hypothetical protein
MRRVRANIENLKRTQGGGVQLDVKASPLIQIKYQVGNEGKGGEGGQGGTGGKGKGKGKGKGGKGRW